MGCVDEQFVSVVHVLDQIKYHPVITSQVKVCVLSNADSEICKHGTLSLYLQLK